MCMTLSDFSGVSAGTKAIVCDIYDEGISIAWIGHHGKTRDEIVMALEAMREGDEFALSGARGFLVDGFSRDDLQYLAFATEKRPDVDPKVYRL